MKTITFYSYKGGVGRSLALSNIAARLSEYKKKVCVIDFDLDAPGLHLKFKNYSPPVIKHGLVDYIHQYLVTGDHNSDITEYSILLKPLNKVDEAIRLIPAGDTDSAGYWKNLSSLNWSKLFYDEGADGVRFFLELKNKIKKEFDPDILLIDSRTGITDTAVITLRLLADEVVVLAANNRENINGSKKIIKSLLDASNSLLGKTPIVHFVLTRLPFTNDPKDREKEFIITENIRNEFKKYLDVPEFQLSVIHSDRRLEENERLLIGYEYDDNGALIANDYLKLFDRITFDILDDDTKHRFKNKKSAQREYQKGMQEKDYGKRLEHLNEAIKLDGSIIDYYWSRGFCNSKLKKYREALEDYSEALKFKPDSAELLCNIGSTYADLDNRNKAIEYLDKAIEINPNYPNPYALKVHILKKQNKVQNAREVLDKLIELFPNNDYALNARADVLRFLGKYDLAFNDIIKAIDINPEVAIYFGTLAEIYAAQGKNDEFYLNLTIALSKGINAESLRSAKDLYFQFKDSERFVRLIEKYGLDIEEIFQ